MIDAIRRASDVDLSCFDGPSKEKPRRSAPGFRFAEPSGSEGALNAETTFVDGRRRGKRRQTLQLKEYIVYQAKGLVCDTAGIHEFGTDIEAGDRRPDKVCTSAEFLIVRNAEDVAESRRSHVGIVADPHH